MTLPAASTEIKFSQIQTEFGGTNPISLSEYYRDSNKTTASLQDSGTNMSATTRPHTSTSNANIATSGQIKMSQFASSREYALSTYSYAGTGGLINFVGQNGFASVGGGIWTTRYRNDGVISFVIPYVGRLRVDNIAVQILSSYDSGTGYPIFDDTDWSGVGYPGIVIRDNLGNDVLTSYASIQSEQSNDVVSSTISAAAINIPANKVGTTYYLDLFCEGFIGESAGNPTVSIGAVGISIATD